MALVKTLHERDIVRIGDDITIALIYVRGDTVRLSIDAPAHLKIADAGQLTGQHHGHGGGRLDAKGNPRFQGPHTRPQQWSQDEPQPPTPAA